MSRLSLSSHVPDCAAVLAVVFALLSRWLLGPVSADPLAAVTLFPAVAVAAYLGGLRSGLLATFLGTLGAGLFLSGSRLPRSVPTAQEGVGLVLFFLTGTLTSCLCERLHRARRQAEELAARLREREHPRRTSTHPGGGAKDAGQEPDHKRQRAFMRLVLENSPIPMGVLQGPDYRCVLVNGATSDVTSLSPPQLLGRRLAEILPQAFPVFEPYLDRARQSGQLLVTPELETPLPDGRVVFLQIMLAPVPGRKGSSRLMYLVLDRTQHRWTEQERDALVTRLEAERTFLEAVLSQMPGGVILVEAPSGRVLLRNAQMAELFGPTADSLPPGGQPDALGRGAPLGGLLHRSVVGGEVVVGAEMNLPDGGGERRTLRVSSAPVRDGAGNVRAAVATFFDITEQRRAEEAQRFLAEASEVLASSLDYETTLTAVAHLVVPRLADWCGVFVSTDDGALRQLTVAHADPAKVQWARELAQRYPPSPDAPRGAPQVFRTGQPEVIPEITEEMLVAGARDDEHLAILRNLGLRSLMAVPLNARGRTVGVVSFVTAESGHRYGPADLALAEELARRAALAVDNARLYRKLQEALALLDTLLDNAPVGFAFLDLTFRRVRINKALVALHGRPAETLLGKRPWDLLPRLKPILEPVCRRVVETGEPSVGLEVRGETQASPGRTRHWLVSHYPVRSPGGELLGVGVLVADISERKAMEEELRQTAGRLAEASRRKDEFLALLGHELRNPLGPIRNAVQLLSLGENDPVVVTQAREMVGRQVAQMTRLVDELLDASRIVQGKIQLRCTRLDLGALARATVEDHRTELEAVGLRLQVDVPTAPLWVQGDAARLTQVIGNLLQNASKFTDPGGAVTVRAHADDHRAVVSVRDTGIGIAPEALPRLFEVFSQVENSLERNKGGLGLGLSVVRGVVELHGGRVGASSEGPGRGAAFTFWLPLAGESAAEVEQKLAQETGPRPAAVADRARKVVIIEDSKDAAESLRLILALQGFEVEVAPDGPAGLALARRTRPDAVVCDLGLPGMSGFEVARALRADPATVSIRLVCVSGYGKEQDRRQALAAGFEEALVKPVDPDELAALLSRP